MSVSGQAPSDELGLSNEHRLDFLVRDNECDQLQGVNNSHYMSYFEHARYQYLREHLRLDVAKMANDLKLAFVVASCNIDFHRSLIANDRFYIKSKFERIGSRKFQFDQKIYYCNSDYSKPLASAVFVLISIDLTTGRAKVFDVMDDIFQGSASDRARD